MGRSARAFLVAGTRCVESQGPGYWVALSGAPSPDANMALVDTDDATVLAAVVGQVRDSGLPTLIMLAGSGRGGELGGAWQNVGDMPFMALALDGARLRPDQRVRQAAVDDFDIVSELVASSFNLTQDVADYVARILEVGDTAGKIWLLVDGAQAVSTVLTSVVDDAVCVWCMGTPARFARRGYGRGLLNHVLLKAQHEGAKIGLLGATPAGKPLYEATGWATLEQWQLFLNTTGPVQGH
jgi:GNAT superfamily N-acetyltransferase